MAAYPHRKECLGRCLGPSRNDGNVMANWVLTQPGPPVFAKARRLDPDKLEIAKKEFESMEKAGIVRRSTSPWSSPLHMVKKKDGDDVQACVRKVMKRMSTNEYY